MPTKLSIDVFKLNGESLSLSIDRQTNVLLLKHKIAELWQVPPECLKLVHCGELLENSRIVSSLPKERGAKLSVSCVISWEDVFTCLEKRGCSVVQRQNSLRALAESPSQDYTRATKLLKLHLHDADFQLREIAMQGLVRIAKSDAINAPAVLDIAREALGHPDEMVRSASAELIGEVASKGDRSMIKILCKHVGDSSYSVKSSLITSLSQIAPGDKLAIKAILALSLDGDWLVRETAARVIGEIFRHQKNDDASEALMRLAKDEERNVRIVAARSLPTMQH